MVIEVYLTDPSSDGKPWKQALKILNAGEFSEDAFNLMAEYFSENRNHPEQISPEALAWIANAMKRISGGEDPGVSLGLGKPAGRPKANSVLASKISAFIELKIRTGLSKNKAIQIAADEFHKDPRHIQRLLNGFIRMDYSNLSDEDVKTIMDHGLDLKLMDDRNLK